MTDLSDLMKGNAALIGSLVQAHAPDDYMLENGYMRTTGGVLLKSDYPILAKGRGLQSISASWVSGPTISLSGGSNNNSPASYFGAGDIIGFILRGTWYVALFSMTTGARVATTSNIGGTSSNGPSTLKILSDRVYVGTHAGLVDERAYAAPSTPNLWNGGASFGGPIHVIEEIDGYIYVCHAAGIHRCPVGADKALAGSWERVLTGSYGSFSTSSYRPEASFFKEPIAGNLIFTTGSTSNIAVSTNGGASFATVNAGPTSSQVVAWKGKLWRFPSSLPTYANSAILMAETNAGYRTHASDDGGVTWYTHPMRLMVTTNTMAPFVIADNLIFSGPDFHSTSPTTRISLLTEPREGAVEALTTPDICTRLISENLSGAAAFKNSAGTGFFTTPINLNAVTPPLYRMAVTSFDLGTQFALPSVDTSPPTFIKVE